MAIDRNPTQRFRSVYALLIGGLLSGCDSDLFTNSETQSVQGAHSGAFERSSDTEVPAEIQSVLSANGAVIPKHDESYGQSGSIVQLTNATVKAVEKLTYEITVDYQFSRGKPIPSRHYAINLSFNRPYCDYKTFAGSQLGASGQLRWVFKAPDIPRPPRPSLEIPGRAIPKNPIVAQHEAMNQELRFEIALAEQVGKGTYHGISNLYKGTVISN